MSKPRLNWELIGHQLPVGGNLMSAGCKHRARPEACGGCHARLFMALHEVLEHPKDAVRIVEAVFAALKGDA